ncbi:hypothetical protein [Micromonospora tulbaghiae]|uniref:hypothetical protein n=1 Tax=Micromonospora tulbaghiae TaxID=479978 RepID=UPI003EBF2D55
MADVDDRRHPSMERSAPSLRHVRQEDMSMLRSKVVLMRLFRSQLAVNRRIRGGLFALAMTAVAVFAAPTPSLASGDLYFVGCEGSYASCQTGVRVSLAEGVCTGASASYGATIVCVDYNGDYVYVKDNDADGRSAMARIDSERGVAYRYCRNTHGAGSWARCNFDWSEAGEKKVNAGILQNYATMPLDYLWRFSNN